MPKLIEIPGVGDVEFPDNMSDDAISATIEKDIMPNYAKSSVPEAPTYDGDPDEAPIIRKLKSLDRPRAEKAASLFSPDVEKEMTPAWNALTESARNAGYFGDKALGSDAVASRKSYEGYRNQLSTDFNLDPEDVDDLVKHRMGAQTEKVSRDAVGTVHIKDDVLAGGVDGIKAAVLESKLPDSVKTKVTTELPERVQMFKDGVLRNLKQNHPELASTMEFTGDVESDYASLNRRLAESKAGQFGGGFSQAFQKRSGQAFNAIGLFADKFTEPLFNRQSGISEAGDIIAEQGKVQESANQLSEFINQGKVRILGTDAATIGQGVASGVESVVIGAATGGLGNAVISADRIAKAGKIGAAALKFSQGALNTTPIAGFYGTDQALTTYDQAVKAGKAPGEAAWLAATSGAIEFGVTAAFGGLPEFGGLENVGQKLVNPALRREMGKSVAKAWGELGVDVAKGFAGEITEESIITALDTVAVQAQINPNMTQGDLKKALYDTVIATAFAAGPMVAGGAVREQGMDLARSRAASQLEIEAAPLAPVSVGASMETGVTIEGEPVSTEAPTLPPPAGFEVQETPADEQQTPLSPTDDNQTPTNDNQQPTPNPQSQVPVPPVPGDELAADPASESPAPESAAAATAGPEAAAPITPTTNEPAPQETNSPTTGKETDGPSVQSMGSPPVEVGTATGVQTGDPLSALRQEVAALNEAITDEASYSKYAEARDRLAESEFQTKYNARRMRLDERDKVLEPLEAPNKDLPEYGRWVKGEKVKSNSLGGEFRPSGNTDGVLFRGITEEDWVRAQEQGYLDTDGRGAIAPEEEQINLAKHASTGVEYIPSGKSGVVLSVDPKGLDIFMIGADDYPRARGRIPMGNIRAVSPVFKKGEGNELLSPLTNEPNSTTPQTPVAPPAQENLPEGVPQAGVQPTSGGPAVGGSEEVTSNSLLDTEPKYQKVFSNENISTTPAADQTRDILQTISDIGASESPSESTQGPVQNLVTWARGKGRLIADTYFNFLGDPLSNDTSEHEVWYDPSNGRMSKRTWAGVYGQIPTVENGEVGRKNATPQEYLKRLALQNTVFGSDIRLEGVHASDRPSMIIGQPSGQPSMVISQEFIIAEDPSNPSPSDTEIKTYMESKGFSTVQGAFYGWSRPDGVVVIDAKPDNFVKTTKGVVPLDLQIDVFSEEEMQSAGLPTEQSPAQNTPESPVGEQESAPPISPTPNPELSESNDEDVLALRKSWTDSYREAQGLMKSGVKVSQTDQEALEAAAKRIADHQAWEKAAKAGKSVGEGPLVGAGLVADLAVNPRVTDKTEKALLLHELMLRDREVSELRNKAKALSETASVVSKSEAENDVTRALEDLEAVLDTIRMTNSMSGLALQAAKLVINRQYDLATMRGDRMRWLNGKENTPTSAEIKAALDEVDKIHAEIKRASERYERAEQALKDYQDKVDEEAIVRKMEQENALREAYEKGKQEAEAKGAKSAEARAKRSEKRESKQERLQKRAEAARVRLRKRLGMTNAGVDPTFLADLADLGASYLLKSELAFEELVDKLVGELGEKIRGMKVEHLRKVYENSLAIVAAEDAEDEKDERVKQKVKSPDEILKKIDAEKARSEGLNGTTIYQMAQAYVRGSEGSPGLRGRAVLDAVLAKVQEVLPEATREQVSDAFTGYGRVIFPSNEEDNVILGHLRNAERIQRQIEDIAAGRMPKRTGNQRRTPDQLTRDLTKQRNEALRAAGFSHAQSPESLRGYLDSVERRLRNQIEDLDKAITENTPLAGKKGPKDYTDAPESVKQQLADNEVLRKQRDALRKLYDAAFPPTKKVLTDAEKLVAIEKALDREIALEESMAAEGNVVREGRQKMDLPPELQQKRDYLNSLKGIRKEAYKAKYADEIERKLDEKLIKDSQKRAAALQKRIENNDYDKKVRTPKPMSRELMEARHAELMAKQEWSRLRGEKLLANLGWGDWSWHWGKAIVQSLRIVKLGLELGVGGRQLFTFAVKGVFQPKTFYDVMKKTGVATYSRAAELEQWNEYNDTKLNPDALFYKRDGIILHGPHSEHTGFKEDIPDPELFERMAELRNKLSALGYSAEFVLATERFTRSFINGVRVAEYRKLTSMMRGGIATPDEGRVIGNAVMNFTGRYAFDQSWIESGLTLANVFTISARWALSRLAVMTGQPLWTTKAGYKGTGRARAAVAYESYLKPAAAGIVLVQLLAQLLGRKDDEEKKPDGWWVDTTPGTTYGEFYVNGQKSDFSGGLRSYVRLLSSLGDYWFGDGFDNASMDAGKLKKINADYLVKSFKENRRSPLYAWIYDTTLKNNYYGKKEKTAGNIVSQLAMPIIVQDTLNVYRTHDPATATLLFMLLQSGVSMQTNPPDPDAINQRQFDR